MQRYLVARESCDSDEDAVLRARVSIPILLREVHRNPSFATLRQQAIDRTLSLGLEDSSRLAREGYPSLVQHAIQRATNQEVRDRDQATWVRLVGETAGAIGGQASLSVTVPVQVNVYQGSITDRIENHPRKPTRARTVPKDT